MADAEDYDPSHPSDQGRPDDQPNVLERILKGKSHFERLGLEARQYTSSEVRKAYRGVAIKVHPDKCSDPQATEAFQILSEAFDVLSNSRTQVC